MAEKAVFPSDMLNLETAQNVWDAAAKEMKDGVRELIIIYSVPAEDGQSIIKVSYMDADELTLLGLLTMGQHVIATGGEDDT